ncbi:MAG: tetratricopeptide repeat protein [Pseudonocardiales bacterium]|nr:tetratricopeptide repeat protein [Pseudonocardiales bacterium]
MGVVVADGGLLCAQAELLLNGAEDRHPEAIELLRQAVAAGEPGATALLGRAYLERGMRHEAIDLLTPLVDAGHTEFAGPLGDALAGIGDHEAAEDAYRVAIDAGDVGAINDLAVLISERGRTAEGIQLLERAVEAGDELAPMTLVGVQLMSPESLPLAIATAEELANTTRPNTLVALAHVRAAVRRYDDAERLYRQACELHAHRAHLHYGWFLQEVRDDPAGAEREYRLARGAQEPGWALSLGRFLLDSDRRAEARPYLELSALWGGQEAAALIETELDGVDPLDD